MNKHTRAREFAQHLGQEFPCHSLVYQERLSRVTHAHTLGLGIHNNGAGLLKVGCLMHIDMAVARACLDYRHQTLAHTALNKPRAATWNKHVHHTAH